MDVETLHQMAEDAERAAAVVSLKPDKVRLAAQAAHYRELAKQAEAKAALRSRKSG